MRQLKVIVASPDEALFTRTASVLANRGHRVLKRCTSSIEALEACFDEIADLAVLDDDLKTVSGSHIARVLRDLRSPVAALVVHRGNGGETDESLLILDPTRDGFEAALLNIADSLRPPGPTVAGRTRLAPVNPARAT
jgi:2-phospho-L-lactate guanylyltransferase (CobY/MobA/RfbA family)